MATSDLIRYRLPRGIVVLLLVVVTAVVGTGYVYLRSALLGIAADRAQTAATRLAASLSESSRQLGLDLSKVVSDSSLESALVGGSSTPSAERLLAGRIVRSTVAVRVLDSANRPLLAAGSWPTGVAGLPAAGQSPDTLAGIRVGGLQSLRDTIYYAIAMPVRVRGVVRGSFEELRRISGTGTAKAFADLAGSGAGLLIGNADGSVWTNLERRSPGPTSSVLSSPSSVHRGLVEYRSRDGTQRIGVAVLIARTPWAAWVEFPTAVVLAPARRFLAAIGSLAIVALLIGGFGAWRLSQRIVGPLDQLTHAAEGIAAGDLSQRVLNRRDDELGRLATAFNAMAQQVEGAHRTLEDRVAERTAELHAAQEELVRKERLATLGQLAGSVGHELRNPLGVITNSLYLLAMLVPDDPPLVKEYLGIIKGQVTLSEKIVGDLLDFARVKQPQTEAFDLRAVALQQIARVGAPSHITVCCENGVPVPRALGDPTQVGQIVLNLVANAVQAVGESPGTVTVEAHEDKPGMIRLDIIDSGCGVPPENIGRIFDALFTTKARGIGLGLSVSRQLARANGGDIVVVSEPGLGSTFSLIIPSATMSV